MKIHLTAIFVILLCVAYMHPEKVHSQSIQALYMTGGCCHNYEEQNDILLPAMQDKLGIEWTNTYGNARIVGTTAGHNSDVIATPVYLNFVANAIDWVVNGD